MKSAPGEDILRAIATVAAGMHGSIRTWRAGCSTSTGTRPLVRRSISGTHRAGVDVLKVIGRGLKRRSGRRVFVSEATLKTHLIRVLTKLDLRDRSAAIVFAHDNHIR